MAWLEIHQALATHRKTIDAARLLGVRPPHLMGCMVSLWLWAIDSAPDGDLTDADWRTLAREAAQWHGRNPTRFIEVLIEVGFLDYLEGSKLFIHNWKKYSGAKLIYLDARKEYERNRKRDYRASQEALSHGTVPECPNSTEQNRTEDRTAGSSDSDFLAELATHYADNVGEITPMLAEEFKNFVEVEFPDLPIEWAKDAVMEAVANGVRKWSYIRPILERWAVEGRSDTRNANAKVDPKEYINRYQNINPKARQEAS